MFRLQRFTLIFAPKPYIIQGHVFIVLFLFAFISCDHFYLYFPVSFVNTTDQLGCTGVDFIFQHIKAWICFPFFMMCLAELKIKMPSNEAHVLQTSLQFSWQHYRTDAFIQGIWHPSLSKSSGICKWSHSQVLITADCLATKVS